MSTGLVYTDLRVSFSTDVKVYAIIWEPDNYFWSVKELYDKGSTVVSGGETKQIMSCYKLNVYAKNLTNTSRTLQMSTVTERRVLEDGTYICWGGISVPILSPVAFVVDAPCDGTLQFSGNHYHDGFDIVITDFSTGNVISTTTPPDIVNGQIHISVQIKAGQQVGMKCQLCK